MIHKELYFFAGQCLTLDEVPEFREKIVQVFESDIFEVEEFVKICDQNFILPAVYVKFRKNDLLSLFPESIRALLANVYDLNKKRNVLILKQIEEINAILQNQNILPIYLKGTAHLMDGLYHDIGERMIGDIDFLVQEKDSEKAINGLKELGYRNHSDLFNDTMKGMHYPPLFKDDSPVIVEIHHTPVDYPYSKLFSVDDIFEHKKKISERENCFVPGDTHQLIHNFIHSQLANLGYVFKKSYLRDLYDLYLITKNSSLVLDLGQVEQKNKLSGYLNFSGQVFNVQRQMTRLSMKETKVHCFFCNSSLKYPGANRVYGHFIKLIRLIRFKYLNKVAGAVFQKQYRKFIYRRVSTRVWYKRHWRGLKDYFKA